MRYMYWRERKKTTAKVAVSTLRHCTERVKLKQLSQYLRYPIRWIDLKPREKQWIALIDTTNDLLMRQSDAKVVGSGYRSLSSSRLKSKTSSRAMRSSFHQYSQRIFVVKCLMAVAIELKPSLFLFLRFALVCYVRKVTK